MKKQTRHIDRLRKRLKERNKSTDRIVFIHGRAIFFCYNELEEYWVPRKIREGEIILSAVFIGLGSFKSLRKAVNAIRGKPPEVVRDKVPK